jgi:spore germination cell wall hydrolase CwlJ-like protein
MRYLIGFLVGSMIALFVLGLVQTNPQIEMTKFQPLPYPRIAEQLGQHYRSIYIRRAKAIKLSNELTCLTDNVYQEAGFETEQGQLAVATVVLNRVKSSEYPKTICGVVYERHIDPRNHKIVCQFSWTCKPRHKANKTHYRQAREIAKKALFKHQILADVNGATLYHAIYVHPEWANKTEQVQQIGLHVFYRE